MIDEQQWYSVPQAARLLDLPRRTVIRWLRSGRLESMRDSEGNLGVSLKNMEPLQREHFFDCREQDDSRFDGEWIYDDAPAGETPIAEEPASEPPRDIPDEPEPEKPSARDPLSALEQQAERSIQAAGAAFYEAKELAIAYRDELQAARREHRGELHRARRLGRFAWALVAASVLVMLGGALFLGRQYGDRKLHEVRVSNLTDRLGRTSTANRQLQTKIESLRSESAGIASELHSARLAQADAAGQLAAFRAHAGQLSHRVDVLEAQIRNERSLHKKALLKEKQRAVEAERKRLAFIRQQRAEEAEKQRREIAARARAKREALQRQQERVIQAQRARDEQRRRAQRKRQSQQDGATLARVDRRTRSYRRQNETANLTLTELEEALTPKK